MFKIHSYLLRHNTYALIGILLFIAITAFTASRVTLEEDVSRLVPAGERQDVLRRVLDHTEFSDIIIMSISSNSEIPNPVELTGYAQQFIDSARHHLPEYINDIQGKVPEEGIREIYNFVYGNLPLFLNEDDYRVIENRIEEASIRRQLRDNFKVLISPTGLITKEFIFKDPLSITGLGLQKLEELQVDDDFELYNNFLVTRDHRHVLLFINPRLPASETNQNQDFVTKLTQIQDELNDIYPRVTGEFFGGVLYAIANANQIKRDIKITIGIAGSILLFLLVFYYRKIYVPLVLFIPSIIGGITAIAFLVILKGSISTISLGIGAILLGISLDYSLHILTHLKNNNNLQKLYNDVTAPVLMSSFTTAVAFLCLLFLRSEALRDLGIFASVSVITASIFALILIPVLYRAPAGEKQRITFIDKIASVDLHKRTPLVLIIVLIFGGALMIFTGVRFNKDLAALNYAPPELTQKEERILELSGRAAKSVFLVSYGNTIDEALDHNNELYRDLTVMQEEGDIITFSSIGGVVLSTSTQLSRIERWQEFWTLQKRFELRENLTEEGGGFGFRPQSFQSFYNLLNKNFEPIYLEDYRQTTTLYLDDFITTGNNFATVITTVNANNMDFILDNFSDRENVVIVDRKQINEGFLGNLRDEFNRLISFSLIAVFLMLLFFYRSLTLTIFTLLPIGITWIITLAIMVVFSVEFNILNIIISTFIFGLGLDYSIFITNAFLKEYETGKKVLKTYKISILLSVITTLLGIGALFFAQHPALRSISMVSIIGVVAAMLVSFVLQSYIFQRLFIYRKSIGKPAFTLFNTGRTLKSSGREDKLYCKNEVLNNYRYKKEFSQEKRKFEIDKERYLKVANFLNQKGNVLHYPCERGLLALFLHYKNAALVITGVESNFELLAVAKNSPASASINLNFQENIPENITTFDVVILSGFPAYETETKIKKIITSTAKKVIILEPEYSYRWILDLNFEIVYRQNEVVLLQLID